MGSKNCTHCWSGFGQGEPGNVQKGVQQPVEPGSQAVEVVAVSMHRRPLSQALANSQGSLAWPSSPDASRTQVNDVPSGLGMHRSSPGQSWRSGSQVG